MENEKLFDFSYYIRIFKSIKDWWNWNITFFKMKRGEWKLEDSMKLADIYTKRWNKKYYVIPDPKGNPIVLNSLEFEYYKRKGIFNKHLHAFDLQKDCYYQTYPK
jgi:hypothetical protein